MPKWLYCNVLSFLAKSAKILRELSMRSWLSPDKLDEARESLAAAVESLAKAIALMRDSDVPFLLLHGEDQVNTKSKAIRKWADGVLDDVTDDIKDFKSGVATKAERQVFQRHGKLPPKPEEGAHGKPRKAKRG